MKTTKLNFNLFFILFLFFSGSIFSQFKNGRFYAYTNSPQYWDFIYTPSSKQPYVTITDEKGVTNTYHQDAINKKLFRSRKNLKKVVSYGGNILIVNYVTRYRKGYTKANPALKYLRHIKTGDYYARIGFKSNKDYVIQIGTGKKIYKTYWVSHIWKLTYSSDGKTMYLTPRSYPGQSLSKLTQTQKSYLNKRIICKLGSFAYYTVTNKRNVFKNNAGLKVSIIPNANAIQLKPYKGGSISKQFSTKNASGSVNVGYKNLGNQNKTVSKTVATTNTATATNINAINPSTKTAKIHDAARTSKYDEVEDLVLKKGANPNLQDKINGRTALHYAASSGDGDIVNFLAKNGNANLNLRDGQGNTPLDLAIEKNNLEIAKSLLQSGANANLANKGLERVINTKNNELLKMFLQNKANPAIALDKVISTDDVTLLNTVLDNSSATVTNSAFEKAVSQRSQQIAIEMLIRGLDKDKAMDFVIKKKDKQMVSLILGTNPNVGTSNKALVFGVEQRDMNLATDAIDNHNANATLGMAAAVKNNHLQMVEFLLSKGADANNQMETASGEGKKAIVEAFLMQSANPDLGVKAAANSNQVSTLQVLLDANGDANLAMPIAIEKGNLSMVNMCITASNPADVYRTEYIITTCKKSNVDILNALLLAGADPNPGMPISIGKKDIKLVRELVTAGATVDKPEYIKKSAELKDITVAQLLLEKGADPNPGMPAAIKNGDSQMVDLFLKKGADGKTPDFIATASKLGNSQIVKMLLGAGADPNYGVTAAVKANKNNILKQLIEAGADGTKDADMFNSAFHNNPSLTQTLIDAGGNPKIALGPAVNKNSYKLIPLLKDNNVDVTDSKLLHYCVDKNFTNTAKALVEAGSSASDWWDESKGVGLLHISIQKYLDTNMINLLAKAGADVNKKTKNGDSPLHLAVYQGKKKKNQVGAVVVALIALKADVNATNAKGETVLKAAPSRRAITRPLKKAGAKRRI